MLFKSNLSFQRLSSLLSVFLLSVLYSVQARQQGWIGTCKSSTHNISILVPSHILLKSRISVETYVNNDWIPSHILFYVPVPIFTLTAF